MGYTAKLKRGARSIDLTTNGYSVLGDFVPPTVSEVIQTAGGTSANKRGGSVRTGSKAVNAPFSFGLKVEGGSSGEIQALVDNLDYFLRQAGNESDPTYLEWRPDNNVSFEPLWGQWGASRRMEIVSGSVYYPGNYLVGSLRERGLVGNRVDLEIKPYALGAVQKIATAAGGILEDTIGSPDGRPRGTIIPEATTNKFDWSAVTNGASLITTATTDPQFILFNSSTKQAFKVTRVASAAYTRTYSLDVGNTNAHTLSIYAKRPDGAAVSDADIKLYYGSVQTTTYTAVGDGWYRLAAAITGVASATATGVEMQAIGRTIYIDGLQIEEKTYATPYVHGDMLGCAWTGADYATTSTRTAASCKVIKANALDTAQGTLTLIWKIPFANTVPAASIQLWTNPDSLRASYNGADDKIYFTDNTNTISSAAQTFSLGDIIVLHFTWGPGGLNVYKNGSNIATGATYTPPSAPDTYVWIGSSGTTTIHCGGTFLGFITSSTAMTAAQVLADYTNIYQKVTGGDGYGQRVSSIPWLWTIGGDDVIDDYANYTNMLPQAFAAGIDGSFDAKITGVVDGGTAPTAIAMTVLPTDIAINQWDGLFYDYNGGAKAAAWTGAVGGTVLAGSVTTAATVFADLALTPLYPNYIYDVPAYMRLSIADAGTALQMRIVDSANGTIPTPWKYYTVGTALTAVYVGPFDLVPLPSVPGTIASIGYSFNAQLKRASGTALVNVDYQQLMLGELTYVPINSFFVDVSFGDNDIYLKNGNNYQKISHTGIMPVVYPGKYNLISFGFDVAGETVNIDRNVTLLWYITPRWAIA